jgi:ABC-type phosphate/phosphonate transport system substrate-binding protein
MIKSLAICAALALTVCMPRLALAQGAATPFRVGVIADQAKPCAARTGVVGADALAAHLSGRLQRPVEVCSFASTRDAGQALAAGAADFVALDADGMAAAGPGARSLLTPRPPGSIGRILSVAVLRADAPQSSLGDLGGLRFVYGNPNPAYYAGPKAAIADNGLPAGGGSAETIANTPEEAFARLVGGQADVLILQSSAWQRLCRGAKPTDKPCAGLKEVWRGRARPERAFGVRSNMDLETLHRLVGVMVALHLENPPAFKWLAPGAVELTPTEADALRIGLQRK